MIYHARRKGWATIDATQDIFIIHQNHDYSHLPNGQAHYRLPETYENVRMAGGYRTIFTLADASCRMVDGCILPIEGSWPRVMRELETFPQRRFQSIALANTAYSIFHPVRAYRDFRKWLKKDKRS
jgi:hypothetical protein